MAKPQIPLTKGIEIPLLKDNILLLGILTIPQNAKGIVVFAHGSGSGRLSPRNQYVAHHLENEGLATLLLDLLTANEEAIDITTREYRFDIPLLAKRLVEVARWLQQEEETSEFKIAYFGASTGAAAALLAASQSPIEIAAIVSRSGRPDIAIPVLPNIKIPTLLIVGGNDHEVIKLNEQALAKLGGKKKLEIIEGATHLFEENGALEKVSQLAADWFKKHL